MKVSFENDRGIKLEGILDGEGNKKGVVLCSHFTGFKELTHLYHVAKALEEKGINALRFDYSDCIGASKGESCEDMALTHQIRDTSAAISFLEDQGIESIGLMGHSLGGTTAIVTAANDTRIKALVPVAALAKAEWDILFKAKLNEWQEQGFITFPTWKKGEIKINYGFYRDLAKYDCTKLIRATNAPVLVIHGDNDETVTIENAKGIFKNANEPKDLRIIEGADHMFSNKDHEKQMIDLAVEWFEKYL
jgi:alpha/beta superfamily hydrolase